LLASGPPARSDCEGACGGPGFQHREREVVVPPSGNGRKCPRLEDVRPCDAPPCPKDALTDFMADCGLADPRGFLGDAERKLRSSCDDSSRSYSLSLISLDFFTLSLFLLLPLFFLSLFILLARSQVLFVRLSCPSWSYLHTTIPALLLPRIYPPTPLPTPPYLHPTLPLLYPPPYPHPKARRTWPRRPWALPIRRTCSNSTATTSRSSASRFPRMRCFFFV
jgi:hypothetical protein